MPKPDVVELLDRALSNSEREFAIQLPTTTVKTARNEILRLRRALARAMENLRDVCALEHAADAVMGKTKIEWCELLVQPV